MEEVIVSGGNYTHLGPCELCGRESNQAGGGHTICTRCEEVWSHELRCLEPDEKAISAWDRAKRICRLKGKIDKLIEERNALEKRVAELEKKVKEYEGLIKDSVKETEGEPDGEPDGQPEAVSPLSVSWGELVISAGVVHASNFFGWLAHAEGGKVTRFNEEIPLSENDRACIEQFVAENK